MRRVATHLQRISMTLFFPRFRSMPESQLSTCRLLQCYWKKIVYIPIPVISFWADVYYGCLLSTTVREQKSVRKSALRKWISFRSLESRNFVTCSKLVFWADFCRWRLLIGQPLLTMPANQLCHSKNPCDKARCGNGFQSVSWNQEIRPKPNWDDVYVWWLVVRSRPTFHSGPCNRQILCDVFCSCLLSRLL